MKALNYYPHEEKMNNLIDYFFYDNSIFYITGNSGCGKSYTLKKYLSNHQDYLFLYFSGDYLHDDKDYYPFLTGLDSLAYTNKEELLKNGVIELTKDIPHISNISNYIANNLINNKKELVLNPIEQEIFSKIQFLINNHKTVLFFDDLHWWDKRSIQLLDIIIKRIEFEKVESNIKIFFTITPNQTCVHRQYIDEIISKTNAKHLEFPVLEYNEFKALIEQRLQTYDTSDAQLHILFNLINNHMKVMTEILRELEKGKSLLDFQNVDGKDYLNELLERRLKEFGATGELISKVLEYASIIGISFSYYELEKVTRINSHVFKEIISHATEMELIQETSEKNIATFAHQIVHELFAERIKESNHEYSYYLTIEQCLSQIKPAEYLRRARYLLKAGELDKAALLYLLDFLRQIRNYGEVSSETKNEAMPIFSDDLKFYLELMEKAYDFHSKKNYEEALNELDLIEEFYPAVLVAEKRILQSFCYTKSLDKEMRLKSFECLESFEVIDAVDGEIEIYERIQNRLMSVYAHLGMIKESSEAEYRLMQNLRPRYKYDENAGIRLNIVRRTYNIVHGCKTSMVFMKKAVDYFGPKDEFLVPDYLKHYYIALVNYSSILTLNGMFADGYEYMEKALKLEKDFFNFAFPRQQILYNNYIINAYLCKKMKISECIKSLENIIRNLPIIAERLTYTSNLSVFYALNNNIEKAYKTLLDEIKEQNVENDIEGFYKFRSYTNLSIYLYLLGNKKEAIKYLDDVASIIPNLNNHVYYQEHHNIIYELINSQTKTQPKEWWNCVHAYKPKFKSKSWDFFGIGYVLASLSNWDTDN